MGAYAHPAAWRNRATKTEAKDDAETDLPDGEAQRGRMFR